MVAYYRLGHTVRVKKGEGEGKSSKKSRLTNQSNRLILLIDGVALNVIQYYISAPLHSSTQTAPSIELI
jgi:hypothetical protein